MSISRPPLAERGQTTAEHAVGTAGAACIACVVWQLFGEDSTGWFHALLDELRALADVLPLRDAP